jgi:Mg-chelatase subunit ChlD
MKNIKHHLFTMILTLLLCGGSATCFSDIHTGKIEKTAGQIRDIIFIIDNSGSMRKNDPDLITKEVVTDFIKKNRDNSFFGMVIFGKEALLAESLADLSSQEASTHFFQGLDRINYRGLYTNTPAAVERAIYELKANGRPDADKVIILLTDGIVDTGDKNSDLEKEKWLKEDLALESKKADIRIFGIAFTDKADFRLIQTLASRTDGEYYRAYTAADIPDVLNKINATFTKQTDEPEPAAIEISGANLPETLPEDLPDDPPALKDPKQPRKEAADKDSASLLPLILSISLVILGIVVLLLSLKRKGNETDEEESTLKDFSVPSSVPEQLQGELIDVENVMQKGSVSLTLNDVSISIGRDSSNDIVIPVDAISSFHATIEFRNGYYHLEDHRSTNGTSLNNRPIKENTPVRLKSGDKINFAVYEFRFLLTGQAPFGETVILQEE